MKHIALVEDECHLRDELVTLLTRSGYAVSAIRSFTRVTDQLLGLAPDLVILDLNLPGEDGFTICSDLKHRCICPVLVLTSRDRLDDELRALGLGADDYLTKPCRNIRLLARVANLLKRFELNRVLLDGDGFQLDPESYTLYCNGHATLLPRNHGIILSELLRAPDRCCSKDHLYNRLWGSTDYIDENALSVNISRLRRTLAQLGLPHELYALRGLGYRLQRKEDA